MSGPAELPAALQRITVPTNPGQQRVGEAATFLVKVKVLEITGLPQLLLGVMVGTEPQGPQ